MSRTRSEIIEKRLIDLVYELAKENVEYQRFIFIFGPLPKYMSFLLLIFTFLQLTVDFFNNKYISILLFLAALTSFSIDLLGEKKNQYEDASANLKHSINNLKNKYYELISGEPSKKKINEFNSKIEEIQELCDNKRITNAVSFLIKIGIKSNINKNSTYSWLIDAKGKIDNYKLIEQKSDEDKDEMSGELVSKGDEE